MDGCSTHSIKERKFCEPITQSICLFQSESLTVQRMDRWHHPHLFQLLANLKIVKWMLLQFPVGKDWRTVSENIPNMALSYSSLFGTFRCCLPSTAVHFLSPVPEAAVNQNLITPPESWETIRKHWKRKSFQTSSVIVMDVCFHSDFCGLSTLIIILYMHLDSFKPHFQMVQNTICPV